MIASLAISILASTGLTQAETSVQSSSAKIAAAHTESSGRPWYMDVFSREFVANAVEVRSDNVPYEKASSVAKVLVDSALDHEQYTSLASEAFQMWITDGFDPKPTSVYQLATNAESAYSKIHQSAEYWKYIAYARSTAAAVFDVKKMLPTLAPGQNATEAKIMESAQRKYAAEAYASLVKDPKGKAAASIFEKVGMSYANDFTKGPGTHMDTSVLDSLLMRAFKVL